jgi:transposase
MDTGTQLGNQGTSRKKDLMTVDIALVRLGLDIDLEGFVACLPDKKAQRFENNLRGFKRLCRWLSSLGHERVLACMEATGRYGDRLASHLHDNGHQVCIINPKFIAKHKEALNKLNKTDPIDAFACGDYARCFPQKLRLWVPKSAEHNELIDVTGHIELLVKSRTAFVNRGKCGIVSESVQESIANTLEHLDKEIEALETRRDELYEQLPDLDSIREIVDSVPGIGKVTANALAAKIVFANFRNGRDLAAFLGLGSREWQSGKQKRRGKMTKAGNKKIRSCLRMGALAAVNSKNSFYLEMVERLKAKGLEEKQILNAVARKMIIIAHALVRKNELFDCKYQHPLVLAS